MRKPVPVCHEKSICYLWRRIITFIASVISFSASVFAQEDPVKNKEQDQVKTQTQSQDQNQVKNQEQIKSQGDPQTQLRNQNQNQLKKQNKNQVKTQTKEQNKVHGSGFVDNDGDGFNDNAPDTDGDGIPNGRDEDYTGAQNRKGPDGSKGFVDLDGDGINDNAVDSDGDGIPNGQHPDYVKPNDGTGQKNQNGKGNNRNGKMWGPNDGTGNSGVGPKDGTGYGSGSGNENCAEWWYMKMVGKKSVVSDGSAFLTGLLLGMNMPASLWSFSPFTIHVPIIASFVAIVITKQPFGGLGFNVFNPALIGRAFALLSWPKAMTIWNEPAVAFLAMDAKTTATPLGILKEEGLAKLIEVFGDKMNLYMHLLTGNRAGSIGEVSTIAILIGGLFLLYKKYITWHIPVSFLVLSTRG